MDPDATLTSALSSFVDNDRDAAIEHLLDLVEWLQRDGVMPTVVRYTDSAFYVRKNEPHSENHHGQKTN